MFQKISKTFILLENLTFKIKFKMSKIRDILPKGYVWSILVYKHLVQKEVKS